MRGEGEEEEEESTEMENENQLKHYREGKAFQGREAFEAGKVHVRDE